MVTQFHQEDAEREAHGDDVGNDDRPSHQQDAIDEPESHASCEAAVHGQRYAAYIFGAKGFDGLWQEAEGGEASGNSADDIRVVHVKRQESKSKSILFQDGACRFLIRLPMSFAIVSIAGLVRIHPCPRCQT